MMVSTERPCACQLILTRFDLQERERLAKASKGEDNDGDAHADKAATGMPA